MCVGVSMGVEVGWAKLHAVLKMWEDHRFIKGYNDIFYIAYNSLLFKS